jgi:hypothetical protein
MKAALLRVSMLSFGMGALGTSASFAQSGRFWQNPPAYRTGVLARHWPTGSTACPRAGLMAVERQTTCANGPCSTTHVALVFFIAECMSTTLVLLSLAR